MSRTAVSNTATLAFYLAGLADGEGCFSISRQNPRKRCWRCDFIIHMRADDLPLLEWLQRETGLGSIYRGRRTLVGTDQPSYRWAISRKQDCRDLVDLFAICPPRSKKLRDFRIWARAVDEWLHLDFEAMERSANELRLTRRYVEAAA